MEPKFKIAKNNPIELEEVLGEFQRKCNPKDLELIISHIHYYKENGFIGHASIIFDYQMKLELGRENIYNAYLRFMSLCLFYFDEGHSRAAWYYLSRAEYFKGVYDAWDEVKKTEGIIKSIKEEKINEKKELNALDKIVLKLLNDRISSSQPTWIDKASFIDSVKSDIHEILNKHKKSRSRPITDGAIKKLVYKFLREDDELNKLFNNSLKQHS